MRCPQPQMQFIAKTTLNYLSGEAPQANRAFKCPYDVSFDREHFEQQRPLYLRSRDVEENYSGTLIIRRHAQTLFCSFQQFGETLPLLNQRRLFKWSTLTTRRHTVAKSFAIRTSVSHDYATWRGCLFQRVLSSHDCGATGQTSDYPTPFVMGAVASATSFLHMVMVAKTLVLELRWMGIDHPVS